MIMTAKVVFWPLWVLCFTHFNFNFNCRNNEHDQIYINESSMELLLILLLVIFKVVWWQNQTTGDVTFQQMVNLQTPGPSIFSHVIVHHSSQPWRAKLEPPPTTPTTPPSGAIVVLHIACVHVLLSCMCQWVDERLSHSRCYLEYDDYTNNSWKIPECVLLLVYCSSLWAVYGNKSD